jgi:hypothetical protein
MAAIVATVGHSQWVENVFFQKRTVSFAGSALNDAAEHLITPIAVAEVHLGLKLSGLVSNRASKPVAVIG